MAPSNEELQAQLRALGLEVRHLRLEVERLRGSRVPEPAPLPIELAKVRHPSALLQGAVPRRSATQPAASVAAFSEKFIGEKVLQYVGALILALGVVFFLVWRAAHTGPMERALIAAGAGAALIALGRRARGRPPYEDLAGALLGGGWSILYITAYASYHFTATKIVENPGVALALLLAAAGGMIAQALSSGSRPFRLYAFALTYALLLVCRAEVLSFELFVLLLAGTAAIAVEVGEADVLLPSLAGFYLNFLPTYFRTIGLSPEQHSPANFLAPCAGLAAGYLVLALLPLLPRARARLGSPGQIALFDQALTLNALAFAGLAASMARVYFGRSTLAGAAELGSLLLLPALGQLHFLGRRCGAADAGGVLPLMLLAAAVFEMPDPMWKLMAWVAVSSGWVFLGLFIDQPVWRAAGLGMSLLTFAFYADVARRDEESRRSAAMALFVFSGLSYFFSRYHRLWLEHPDEWEKPSTEYWLYVGSLSLLLGLWGCLDAAPFLCCMIALALLGEHAAVRFGRAHLWVQASALELFLGVYSFFVDYGAGLVAGVPPRLLGAALVACSYVYLIFSDPMDGALAARWRHWSKSEQRRALSWLLLAVLSFAVWREFDGRLRLAFWAFGSLALYWLGRTTEQRDFRSQSVVLAVGTLVEAGASYITAPAALLPALSGTHTFLYWGSVAALVAALALARGGQEGRRADLEAATVFGVLALVLGAAFLAKELDRTRLTMAWTGLGLAFLTGGLLLGWRELRLPGLGLLGVCVGKALLLDTSGLPLPHRVASFVALGAVLIFASSLYSRAGASGGG